MVESDIAAPACSGNSAYVYIISAGSDAVKVGRAVDPKQRMRDLQTSHYQRLSLIHVFQCGGNEVNAIERQAQALLSEKRLAGEWFSVNPDEAKAAVGEAMN